ncbi:MAG TPA: acetate--CoA ligase [Gemmatimonadales bacterium]|jgi:acetyl-CoA synthetase|nr:acetate--CoA ligase [Gemmatimonadales bacterium]
MTDQFETLLTEKRRFSAPAEFAAKSAATTALYVAGQDWQGFWEIQAGSLEWMTPWNRVLDWQPPRAQWFAGGKLNASVNCLDRHLRGPRRHKAALIWEGEPGDRRTLTYWQLAREVGRCANALKRLGVQRGDRVAIYLPMIPEAVVAMLACARIGAVHSVVFGGFSSEALRDRINDAGAVVLITADGGYRRGQVQMLKRMADAAMAATPSIKHCVVVRRRSEGEGDETFAEMTEGRDHWWHRLLERESGACAAEVMDAEDMLFILYTSGTTGKPKGIVHTTGGYLTHVASTSRYVFDLGDEDVFWCTADVGWVTGHSYVVYGPLANGATVLMYEGAPDWPERDRFWALVETYGVTILYTAPTAIRAFMKWGTQHPERHDLSTLRLLGTVGEPINPEAWIWYHEQIGKEHCPIVDTWWQTETGGIMITPLPAVVTTKPGSATIPYPGIVPELVDTKGNPLEAGGGFLTIAQPWPGMLRTIYGDDERYREIYWSRFPGRYFTGDGAKLDEDGYWWILGRVDDVLNVAGHRIGTMEVESALVDHPAVAEAAVVGRAHELKGQAIAAFVTLREGRQGSSELKDDLKAHVTQKIGAIARPEDIFFSADLPKTRSGKIMRRLLKDIAEGRALGDTTTLADPAVVTRLKDMYEAQEA